MDIKISESHLKFIIAYLKSSDPDLLTHLQGRFKASSFSIDASKVARLRDWLKEQLQLTNCSEEYESEEDTNMLRNIITYTRWSQKLIRGRNVINFLLPRNHIEFLKHRLQNSEPYLLEVLQNGTVASYFSFDDDFAIKLQDWANEQLQFWGFDKDYNLTKYGQILEDVIDLLAD